ncbi:Hypothetical protein DEACI_2103 [Acididesulfobacillus acetoxydans]|uniref:Uncharacterized protein n=1 Tax=Acididesulfobacillus acetoxydans TaxID=1561005 RepID=A0A8S0XBN2_9FIRM|nr:hypothetical protein [Acididesulfobacillus acetoxydans]CAA7601436.1 Hypothetical protein DEACI_2103 [Acididesulfobacillus acetoxydans]CEJ08867.1 Hypothetical protein DEACI_3349 [Acididesulfobacillus acetoxydans]
MLDFYTYSSLDSLTGAVTATLLVVEFLKNLGPFRHLPTRWLVLMVAEGIVTGTGIFAGHFTLSGIPLCLLNGLLVAASAAGGWHVVSGNLFGGGRRHHGVR